ncbi:MAG: T9SS type A sorting domain-containing protein, partial [Rubricoccaceae bacterium]|nr:T9SS type A sorting domain-containing protein [Rubricoccaceae bacterium]
FGTDQHRGVYRTTDGGTTWDKTLFVNDSTGVVDIAVNPRSSDTLYAAAWERQRRANHRHYGGDGSGLYRSTDGGATWTELTNGLPTDDNVGRIGVAVAESRPNVVYAIYTDAIGNTRATYRSTDGGDSWTSIGSPPGVSYGWWFGQIRVDPTNENVVFAPWLNLYKSTNGGSSWFYSSGSMHVDHHALWIDPANPNQMIAGNDGGVYRSSNGGGSWTKAAGGFPATQFYTVEIDESVPARLYGGTQDNGTNRTLTGALNDWHSIYGGDGFVALVDPTNNQYVYAESQYGNLGRSTNGGTTFVGATSGISGRTNWNTPVEFYPNDSAVMYYGANSLYRSINRAVSWTAVSPDLTDGPGDGNLVFGTITTIGVSPANNAVIWVGTDDGNVWITTNGGASWTNRSNGLPKRWVTRVIPHPTEPLHAFVTISGYRWDEPGANVFFSQDGGASWEARSSGLPEAPANDLLFDPQDSERLFLGTDVGVFTSADAGLSWEMLGAELPAAPVLDLDLHDGTRKLVAATYGRSMYTYDLTMLPTGTEHPQAPSMLSLDVFPNPLSAASATIRFELESPAFVELELFDLLGRRVAVLERRTASTGPTTLQWSPEVTLTSGAYVVRLRADNLVVSKRLTVVR